LFLSRNFKIKIYKIIVLSVALYECETWYFITVSWGRRLGMGWEFSGENEVIERKKKEIYNEELYSFYLPDIITTIKSRNMRWACYEAHMVNTRNT
jgi:hypothetical protein